MEQEEEIEEVSPPVANKSKSSTTRGKTSKATKGAKTSTGPTRSAPTKSSSSKASNPAHVNPTKLAKSRGPGKTARVWRYFKNEYDEAEGCDYTYCELYVNKILPSGEVEKVKCAYKNKGRNTSNMRCHLNSVHKPEAKMLEVEESEASTTAAAGASSGSFQPKVYDFFGNQAEEMIKKRKRNPYPENALIYQRLKANLTRLAACTSFPLMMVGSNEFVTTIYDLDPRAGDSLPSRNTLKKWVINFSEKVQHNLVGTLKRIRNFFVTIDIWSSPGLDKFFLGVIVRFH